jgi:hypothetical protein
LPVVASTPVGPSSVLNPAATGPMPERAGAALGGVLDEGDPVPQLDRHNPALVDLALIGLTQRPRGDVDVGGGAEGDVSGETPGDLVPEVTDPLVTIRGPGGFPLLASSLRDTPAPDFDALVAALPSGAAAATVTAEPATVMAEPASDAKAQALPAPSALSGLTVALGMVFGLRLPDLTALLTVVDAPRRRARFRLGPPRRRGN